MVYIWPIPSNGLSTVFAPIHVKITMIDKRIHVLIFFDGLNFVDFDFFVVMIEIIMIDMINATTPPNFDGMDRRIT